MPVLEKLKEAQGFTASEKELAGYILRHADDACHLGMREMAEEAGKSNGTIMRVCRKAGCEGWSDFRIELAADLERVRRNARSVNPNEPFRGQVSPRAAMDAIAKLQQKAVEDCYASVDPDQASRLAKAMVESRQVIYYGLGDSYATATSFAALISKIGVTCMPADLYRFQNDAAFHATDRDLALFVTYSGDTLEKYQTQIQTLRNRHCRIAAISSRASIAERTSGIDLPVVVPLRENKYGKVATFYSQTCLRYVLNCVYSIAFSKNYANNLHNKDLIEMLEPGLGA
jgi:DNA-binding MurR/RpiR family transcriptional regulator